MAFEYFITEKYLKGDTAITANCDAKDILPWVKTSADHWLQPILGTYFYDYMLGKFNSQTLNADEVILVEKIKSCVAWRAASESVLALSLPLKNIGVQKQNSDNSESADDNTIKFVMAHYRQKAESYESFLVKYLGGSCGNPANVLFPEFISELNDQSIIKPQKTDNFNTGLFFI